MAQSKGSIWPNEARCAVTISYDGAHAEHLALVPLLDGLGLRATFFASPTRLLDNPLGWREAGRVHEIANHSLYGIADGGTLLNWSLKMIEADVKATTKLISELVGVSCRSFALPGWSTACLDGDYLPAIQRMFSFIRSERRETNDWKSCARDYVGSYPLEDVDPAVIVTEAQSKGGWVVFRTSRISEASSHERFLKSLTAQASTIWIAPFSEAAERVMELRPRETLNN